MINPKEISNLKLRIEKLEKLPLLIAKRFFTSVGFLVLAVLLSFVLTDLNNNITFFHSLGLGLTYIITSIFYILALVSWTFYD